MQITICMQLLHSSHWRKWYEYAWILMLKQVLHISGMPLNALLTMMVCLTGTDSYETGSKSPALGKDS